MKGVKFLIDYKVEKILEQLGYKPDLFLFGCENSDGQRMSFMLVPSKDIDEVIEFLKNEYQIDAIAY